MLIGTAGHIDHGKTTLVKALTGVDTDRLPEEKSRGITLDLGYAYATAGGVRLGYVDVPGHEKLVHNMLAGATGIDVLLLVVAADDGPMPQTREHLELALMLGIARGVVALTKCDRVDPARFAAARNEVDALLAGTPLAGCSLFAVAAPTGEGVPALKAHLESLAASASARHADGGFRLAIDRSFTLGGIGTVVTGTAHAGRVAAGDALVVSPAGHVVRVRSLHVQDRPASVGQAGERIALAIAGDFGRDDITRGQWLVAPDLHRPLLRWHARLHVPRGHGALAHWTAVHVHLGAEDITGRVALLDVAAIGEGGAGLVEIVLDRATHAVRGDCFILRDASARHTLAGGRVLDTHPPTRHKRSPERLAILAALDDDDPAVALALLAARSPAGVDLTRYAANWNLADGAANALWARAGLHVVVTAAGTLGFAQAAWLALGERLLDVLAAEHQRAPDMAGVERERLRRMTQAALPRAAFDACIEALLAAGSVAQTRAWLHLPAHRASVSSADADLFATLQPLLDAAPFNPPRVRDVARATGMAEDLVRQLFRRMARAGALYPVAHDHYFTARAVAELAGIVAGLSAAHGGACAADLRDRIYGEGGGGRKVAIHILEFFDRVGYTRRARDAHVVRGDAATQWIDS